jgi:hypothetical protein
MPRHLGYQMVWENCYHSTYGKRAALKNAERVYCKNGIRYYIENDIKDEHYFCQCDDWHKCQGLDRALHDKNL